MKCVCAQTRPWFILSSERVFGGMEFEPMLTPREKSPLLENFPRGGSNPRRCGQRAQTLPTSHSSPYWHTILITSLQICIASISSFTSIALTWTWLKGNTLVVTGKHCFNQYTSDIYCFDQLITDMSCFDQNIIDIIVLISAFPTSITLLSALLASITLASTLLWPACWYIYPFDQFSTDTYCFDKYILTCIVLISMLLRCTVWCTDRKRVKHFGLSQTPLTQKNQEP